MEIHKKFMDLMQTRGFQNMPEEAKRQMAEYSLEKKWTMVYQEELARKQAEERRKHQARTTIASQDGQLGMLHRADEEGTPEWYVKKIMDDSLTVKQLQSLGVSLRTQTIG